MSFFRKMLSPIAEDLMVKLAKYQDFPEEKYELIIENKRLRNEVKEFKADKYTEIIEENKRLQMKVESLQEEKIRALENEIHLLKLNNTLAIDSPVNHMLALAESTEIKELEIAKFVYIGSIFKAIYKDGTSTTQNLTPRQLEEILGTIFPILDFKVYYPELIVYLNDKNKNYISHCRERMDSFVSVSKIESWMKSSLGHINQKKEIQFFEDPPKTHSKLHQSSKKEREVGFLEDV